MLAPKNAVATRDMVITPAVDTRTWVSSRWWRLCGPGIKRILTTGTGENLSRFEYGLAAAKFAERGNGSGGQSHEQQSESGQPSEAGSPRGDVYLSCFALLVRGRASREDD